MIGYGSSTMLETAVCEVDARGRVKRWSPGAARVFGFPPEEAVGVVLPMVPPELHDELLALLQDVADGGGATEQPVVWHRRDGEPIELAVTAAALRTGPGGLGTIVLIARDISERRLEQAQLEVYARDLRESFGRELQRAQDLERSYFATVRALASAVEAKDGYTGGHIQRVHDLGLVLARAVAPAEADEAQLAYGFLLHDVGKLAVPDAVLTKPGRLTDEEWRLMRTHPEAGVRILSGIAFLDRARDVVLHHHERWDGQGYPHGLAGERIPLWARLFAVVDTVDAITSDRPYRRGQPLETAIGAVLAGAGTQFDPACAAAMAALDRAEVTRALRLDR